MAIFLGIDTSCYTTSIAAVDGSGQIISDKRTVLTVKKGMRGLRQSDALFLHTKNLPELVEQAAIDWNEVAAVGVSDAPRRLADSYMPVFLAGLSTARSLAAALGVPCLRFSHQEGHLRAGLHAIDDGFPDEFYAVHLSGGTTELLSVVRDGARFHAEIIGGTKDISAGQLIDRVGVQLGLPFPSGKALEQLSKPEDAGIRLPVNTDGAYLNLSGLEAACFRLIEQGISPAGLAYALFKTIAAVLAKVLQSAVFQYGKKPILIAGGVAANQIIREALCGLFENDIHFASPVYSTDNAVGTALLTKEGYDGN